MLPTCTPPRSPPPRCAIAAAALRRVAGHRHDLAQTLGGDAQQFAGGSSSPGAIAGIMLVKPPNESGYVMPAATRTSGMTHPGPLPTKQDEGHEPPGESR